MELAAAKAAKMRVGKLLRARRQHHGMHASAGVSTLRATSGWRGGRMATRSAPKLQIFNRGIVDQQLGDPDIEARSAVSWFTTSEWRDTRRTETPGRVSRKSATSGGSNGCATDGWLAI